MSIPPLLLERLKKRKIITDQSVDSDSSSLDSHNLPSTSDQILPDATHEEILAENYSDESSSESDSSYNTHDQHNDERSLEKATSSSTLLRDIKSACDTDHKRPDRAKSVIGCPNKYNIYHECGQYCEEHYSQPESRIPSIDCRRQLSQILKAYPLPINWKSVYDPGLKTFYFWETSTNLVSWVPPGLANLKSQSADHIRLTNNLLK